MKKKLTLKEEMVFKRAVGFALPGLLRIAAGQTVPPVMVNDVAVRIFTGLVMALGDGLKREYQEAFQDAVKAFRQSVLGEGIVRRTTLN